VEFSVLGPIEVAVGGQSLSVAGARTRAVLALLVVHANQVVPSDRLIEELWPGHPADKATDSLQVRLSELRKAFRSAGEADRLATRPPGYQLRVAADELDAQRFERLAAEGDAALAAGDATTAAERLDQALSLWRGPALSDVDTVPAARLEAARLEEKRLAALETRAEALLACGRHRELIAELEALQRLSDRITPPCHGRYLASHIAGARYFEQPGDHSPRFAASGNSEALYAEIADFLASTSPADDPNRVLATILHAKAVAGPAPATEAEPTAGDLIRRYRGRPIRTTADCILATFDAPGQAIRCAAAVRDGAAAAGIQIRAGIHTGEVDLVGEDIAGTSVQITDRVAALARPAEILVSRTVKDLVAGSGITFAERGSHALNGPPDEWPLFAVTGFGTNGSRP
jgi:DNA-binding SARP family transcriptional activator